MSDPITLREFLQILVPSLMGAFGGASAAYVGIKVAIARLDARMEERHNAHNQRLQRIEKSADEAHQRIDEFIMSK